MKKLIYLFIVMLLLTLSSALADVPDGGVSYYNFSSVTDLWGSNDATNNGATSVTDYPEYNIRGDSNPNSFNFDGDNDYVNTNIAFNLQDDFSMSFWIKTIQTSRFRFGNYESPEYLEIRFNQDSAGEFSLYRENSNNINMQDISITNPYNFTDGEWHHFAVYWTDSASSDNKIWIDGVEQSTTEDSWGSMNDYTMPTFVIGTQSNRDGSSFQNSFNGNVDEVKIFNRSLNSTEVENLYNYGTIETPNLSGVVTFVSQDPGDITTTNLLTTTGLNITYNESINNLNNIYLNYTINRTLAGCLVSINGTCIVQNNLYRTINYTTNRSPEYDFLLDGDNDVYPGIYNINENFFDNTTIQNYSIISKTAGIIHKLYNVSNETQYSYVEIGANLSDSEMAVYVFNSSYTTGNFRVNDNVAKITEIAEDTTPDHCHSTNNCHYTINLPIINGSINGIKVTPELGFIITKEDNAGELIVQYLDQEIRTSTTQTTNNAGNSWTNQPYALNLHVHEFDGTDKIVYQSCGSNSTYTNCSVFREDTFEAGDFPPTSPQVVTPTTNEDLISYHYNITWNPSTSASATINNYILQLLNSDGTFNQTITSVAGTQNYYDWDFFADNISRNSYYITVIANDSNAQNNSDTSELFNILYDKQINITAYYYGTNETVNNFSVQITGELSENGSTTTGLYQFHGINGSYQIFIDAEGYSFNTVHFNMTERYNSLNISLYRTNTVNISFYDSATKNLLTGTNISFNLIRDELYATNNWTITGNIILELLAPGSYEIRYNAPGYAEGNYFFTLTNRSYNSLDLYLINQTGATNVTSIVYDDYGNALSNYIIQYLQYYPETSSYIEVSSKRTNEEGKAVMSLILNGPYYKVRILDTSNTLVKTTSTTQLYSETVIYYVIANTLITDDLKNINDITSTLTHTGTQFKYDYTQNNNLDITATLKVYKIKIEGYELINSTTITSGSGILYVNTPEINGTTYIAKAFIQYSGENEYLDQTLTKTYNENSKPFGTSGIFLLILLLIMIITLFARQPFAVILLIPFILTISSFLSLIVINKTIIISIWGVSTILLYIIRDKA